MATSTNAQPQLGVNPQLRRRRVTAALIFVTLVVGGTAAFTATVWPGFAVAEPLDEQITVPAAPHGHLRFTPEPRIGEQTALVAALPDVVGVWVQQGITAHLTWQTDNAVEAWNLRYLDGTPIIGAQSDFGDDETYATAASLAQAKAAPAAELQLTVGQWPTPTEAASFLTAQTKGSADPVLSGQVTIAATGESVGKYLLIPDAPVEVAPDTPVEDLPTTPGVMWWRNGTVVIKAVGPINLLAQFYSVFPL